MKRTTITFLMMFSTICCWTQTKDSIDTSNIVVTYNYTGHTTDKNGKKVDDHYRLAVLIGNKTTWSTGFLTALKTEKKERKDMLAELDEQKLNIPSVYVGHPSADEVTIRETMLKTAYVYDMLLQELSLYPVPDDNGLGKVAEESCWDEEE